MNEPPPPAPTTITTPLAIISNPALIQERTLEATAADREEEEDEDEEVEEIDERGKLLAIEDIEKGLSVSPSSINSASASTSAGPSPPHPDLTSRPSTTNSSRSSSRLRLRPAPPTSLAPSYGTIDLPLSSRRKRPPAPTKRKLRSKLLFALITVLLGLCVYASFIDNFLNEVEASISCGTCLGLLIPLQALAHVGDDAFVDFFVGFCTNLGIEDADVCKGAIGTQAPILAHDLRSISLASHAAKNFCGTVFGLCPLQEVIQHAVAFETPVPMEFETEEEEEMRRRSGVMSLGEGKKRRWRSLGRTPMKVVHISDVHIDREYISGSNTICSKVICCRDYGLGSLGPNISLPAGPFGDEHCDSPVDLVQSMFRGIEKHAPDRAFTIFTGDVVEAAVWAVDQPSVTKKLHDWYSEMQAPSYPVIGNHDVSPVNAFPRSTSFQSNSSQWVFEEAAQSWEKWIGPEAADQVRRRSGCYSRVHPGSRLKIISLNTQYWYKQNFWLYDSDIPQWDPNGILSWLARELHEAERLGQRAWIMGHMPFGKVDAMRDQSNYANQIFQRYHETIAAQFYGHTHNDEFEIGYSDYHDQKIDNANQIAFISGALTPASGNPVFRVYDIDPDTYEVMDFTPFYANRSLPSFQIEPKWKPYYSARESYGSMVNPPLEFNQSLDAKFWHRVTDKFQEDRASFLLFNERKSRGGKVLECKSNHCRKKDICMLRSLRSESNCAVIQPGLTFKDEKRDPDAEGEAADEDRSHMEDFEHSACEGPGLGSMLQKLAFMSNRDKDLKQNILLQFHAAATDFLSFTVQKQNAASMKSGV